MYLFKTSGATLPGVVAHQKHAFRGQPRDWFDGELVLVSKNRSDCARGEKQIQYLMRIRGIRLLKPGEAGQFWPGNEGRWKWLVECSGTHRLRRPFNMRDVLGNAADPYDAVRTFKKVEKDDERRLLDWIRVADADALGGQ